MTKLSFTVDDDEMDKFVAYNLRECYEDAVTKWSNEPDTPKLADALLTVLEHYMTHSEFEKWYETIKEL